MAKKTQKDPVLEISWVDVESLKTADYNPRKITPKKKKELRDSIEKFGLRDPLKVNKHPERENVLISGHQRLKICKELGMKQVPVTFEHLTLEQEKEMNLRWNKNGGDFDLEMVVTLADRTTLMDIGFSEKELGKVLTEFEDKFNAIDTTQPELPITPKFNEKHNYVLIVTDKEIDFTWLTNLLELGKQKCYKSENTGQGKVLRVQDFQKLFKKWTSR